MAIQYLLLIGSGLILISIVTARLTDNLGLPTMVLFLGVGMLAGSEGPGGIFFDDAGLAQSIGIIGLVFILFAGGLDTVWGEVRPVVWKAATLSTLGVLLTAAVLGLFVAAILHLPILTGLMLGAVVSSTDAAAVFAVLRSKNVSLRPPLKPLIEVESGSNDPMAVFLTVGLIALMTNPGASIGSLGLLFVVQMGLGLAAGLALGKVMVLLVNRLKLRHEGLYAVLCLAFAGLIYGGTAALGGSGFLAVYTAGLVAGGSDFVQKKSLIRFFDGMAWLSQITLFLTLGLLVYPSHIVPVIGAGLLVSGFLMLVARPLSVFVSLSRAGLRWRELAFVSWVGLRGAVPIVLATFPLLAGLPDAELIFNVVFFIVVTSALLQGWSTPYAARLLKVDAPAAPMRRSPIQFAPVEGIDTELVDLIVPYGAAAAGRSIVELGMPGDSLIVLIGRGNDFLVPSGGTVLQEGDTVLVLVNNNNLPEVRRILSLRKRSEEPHDRRSKETFRIRDRNS